MNMLQNIKSNAKDAISIHIKGTKNSWFVLVAGHFRLLYKAHKHPSVLLQSSIYWTEKL